jgi:hypothetical protein
VFCLGWVIGKSERNPGGWTAAALRAAVADLKVRYPEMPGVIMYGPSDGNATCGANVTTHTCAQRDPATLALTLEANKLMKEFYPDEARSGATAQVAASSPPVPPRARASDANPARKSDDGGAAPTSVKYWFDGDFVPALQKGIVNLGLVVGKAANTKACGSAFCDPAGGPSALADMQRDFDTYGTPSVAYAEMDCQGCGLGIMDTTPTTPPGPGPTRSSVGLDRHWARNLDAFAAELAPYVANGSCAGIFICDECMSAGINFTAYDAVVSRFRAHFPRRSAPTVSAAALPALPAPPAPIIIGNDGMQFWRQMPWPQKLPAGLDIWSFDLYDGFNINASWEVAMVRAAYEAELLPRLRPGQVDTTLSGHGSD